MKNKYPVALIILDGFGYSADIKHNAIAHADMPFFKNLFKKYPWTLLKASGAAVGLPEHTIGNSEVGHMTIGLGAVIKQPLTILNQAIEDGSFFHNPKLIVPLKKLAQQHKTLHIMGLFSDTGVHSNIQHMYAYIKAAEDAGITRIVIHGFLDGRDTDPQSAAIFLEQINRYLKDRPHIELATIQGRSYAMDRDQQWQQTQAAYNLLTQLPQHTVTWQKSLQAIYDQHMTEEFLPPCALCHDGYIKPGDGIIFFNFRPDRARQLTSLFLVGNKDLNITPLPLSFFITPVTYGDNYATTILYPEQPRPESLIDTLDKHGYTTFSIAETTKYAHITYFFNGGKETQHKHETRVLIPSYPPLSIQEHPCMKAQTITDTLIHSLEHAPCDFYLVNYANADMVGHTGNYKLMTTSLACLDVQLQRLYYTVVVQQKGSIIITGDHGNAEAMYNEEKHQMRTAHTANDVYCIVIDPHTPQNLDPLHELKDIAPLVRQLVMQQNY